MTITQRLRPILPLLLILLMPHAVAAGGKAVIETTGHGTINWTEGSVSAWKTAEPAGETGPGSSADSMALRGALANLSETIRRIRIDSDFTVGEYISNENQLIAQVEAMVTNAPVIQKQYLSDGTLRVSVRLSFSGGFAQLLLPNTIRQIEPVKTIASPAPPEAPLHTGLIVDATGLAIQPALAPKVFDENGRQIYGPLFASREYAVHKGTCGYVTGLDAAKKEKRIGTTPLVVKGLRRQGPHGTSMVISNSDAARILSSSTHVNFLNQCRVVIVTD